MSNYSEKNITAYNAKAANYDNTIDGKFTAKFKGLLVAHMQVNEGNRVLDVGCGNGTLLRKIARTRPVKGFGADLSPQMITVAGERYPEFEFTVAGCESLPFEESSMDIITVCCAYHHFPDTDAFALEASRILRPGESLYIADVYLPPVVRQIANVFLPLSKDGDVRFYSREEISRTFSRVGLELVSVVRKGYIQILHLRSPGTSSFSG